jgi:gas vesicle protein
MEQSTRTYEGSTSGQTSDGGQRAREAADEAKDQAQQVAGTASEMGRGIAGTASEKGKEVAEMAKGQVSEVTQEAAAQARNVVDDAKRQLQGQAQIQTDQIADALRRLEGQVKAMLEGRTDEAGAVGDYTRQAAAQIGRLAERTQNRGFDGLVQELQSFGRNRPGTFLAAASAAGFAAARLWRSGAVSQAVQGSSQNPNGAGTGSNSTRYDSPAAGG